MGGQAMNQSKQAQTNRTSSFQHLLSAKKRFLIPLTLFFLLFYFSLPLLTSYVPELMNTPVWGRISLAWLFAFLQFVMTGSVMILYVWRARLFDALVEQITTEHNQKAERDLA
jgi:uncharacterized membrane protein (DUF485 family)